MASDKSKFSGYWNSAAVWSHGVPTSATDALISKNDDVTLTGHGAANSLLIHKWGALDLAGGILKVSDGVIDNGEIIGFGKITGAIGGKGSIVADGGTLELKGPIDTQNTNFSLIIDGDATLKLDGPVGLTALASNISVTFNGAGTLDLSGEGARYGGEPTQFQAIVRNLTLGDDIVVAGDGNVRDKVTYNRADGTLVVTSGKTVLDVIKVAGNLSHYNFTLTQSGATDTITVSAICFMAGTRIATPTGDVAVETLQRGDFVLTTDGMAQPVSWIGRQTISTLFSDPERAWPVRIKAGALGPHVPSRDLVLSPDHAVLVDGVLIHASALVNGTSVAREMTVPRSFVYYHVELDDHALILAENAPAETFIDNADRLAFDNWDEHQALYPEGKAIEEMPYARAKSARQVPVRVRVALAARAAEIGALTADVA